jgi:hypothetical protein
MTRQITELQDLVANPTEREWLELKSWIDLTDPRFRAGTARHLAAIANYGGGYLVFGFNKDGTRCSAHEGVRKLYNQDMISGIVSHYLQPKFQCEVSFETIAGVEHPIVWVPAHGATPVFSKADGPQDSKGRREGIQGGLVYIRTPKPESVPVTTPEMWTPLIQRCVLARRDELVGMFSSIVSGGAGLVKLNTQSERDKLVSWHRATQAAFQSEASKLETKLKLSLETSFVQFSYMIRTRNPTALPPDKMLSIVEKLNNAVRDTVRYGWSMFHPFTRSEISPRFMTDADVDGGNTEFLQTSLLEKGETHHLDFWRVAPDGRASLIRNWHEDQYKKRPPNIAENAKWFDPWLHVRDITEVVRHARAFSEEYPDVQDICFMLEWKGLKSRVVASLNPERYHDNHPHTAQADERVIYDCFPHAEVIGSLPDVVSRLYAPLDRMFNSRSSVSPEWVSQQMKQFIVVGL